MAAQPGNANPNAPQNPKNPGQHGQGKGQGHAAPQGPQMISISVPSNHYADAMVAVGQVMAGQKPAFGPDLQPKLTAAEAEVTQLKGDKTRLEGELRTAKDTKSSKVETTKSKRAAKLIGAALFVCALVYAGIMIGANGGQMQVQVGNTNLLSPSLPNLTADLAAAVNSQSTLQKEIDRLKAAHVADLTSASREQTRLRNELERVMAENNQLTSTGISGKLLATEARLAQVTSESATNLANQAQSYEERLSAAEAQRDREAKEHAEECNAHVQQLRTENMTAIASKDTTIGNLRFQLATDQLLLETYHSLANGDMAHLGERVTVDVVAFAPRNASFQLTLDSGAKTEDGVAIIQTVTGTCSQTFPTPTSTFQTNSALYTIGATINGRTFETGKQFLGVAGETVYMQLHGETFYRQLRFERSTIVIWTGSCRLVRSNPRSNRLPLPNGSRVQLPDGTTIEVQNGQPTTVASASK